MHGTIIFVCTIYNGRLLQLFCVSDVTQLLRLFLSFIVDFVVTFKLTFHVSGTFFILYDFIEYFKKDNPSFLPRAAFLEIIDSIFGSQWPVSQLEKDAIIFQVIL